MAFIARMLHRGAQDAIRVQLAEIKEEILGLDPIAAQEAIATGGPDP